VGKLLKEYVREAGSEPSLTDRHFTGQSSVAMALRVILL